MEKLKPSINIISIILHRAEYRNEGYKITNELKIDVKFRIQRDLSEDKKSLSVILGILLEPREKTKESGYFRLIVEMIGKFTAETEQDITLEAFAKINAPSIIMPYIREAVTDFTSKAGFQPLILPPIPIHRIFEDDNTKEITNDIGCQIDTHDG